MRIARPRPRWARRYGKMGVVPEPTEAEQREINGGCECGAVGYRVEGPFLYSCNCHCSRCRAATGSAYKAFAGIERAKLTVFRGEQRLARYGEANAHDVRCGACASLLFSVVRDGEFVHVALGTVHGDPGISPGVHIHVASKASWHEITDDLPQFQELPD